MVLVRCGRRRYGDLVPLNLSVTAIMDALAGSPLPTTFVDREGVYRFVNRAYERWFGLSWDEVVGKTMEEVLGARAAEAIAFYKTAALGGATVEFESSLPYRTRGVRRMKVVYAAARDADGMVPGFFAFLEDVTARYDAEAAVAAALDGIADGYFALDHQHRVTFINSAAARLLAKPRDQLLERPLDEAFPGAMDGEIGGVIKQVMLTGNPERKVLPSAIRVGRVFAVDVIPLMTGGAGVVLQDVTEKVAQETDLSLARRRFEAAARATLGLMYEWDRESGVVWRSGAFEHVLGVSAADAAPTVDWWIERMHPEDVVTPDAYLDDMADLVERTYRLRHADGSWRNVIDRAAPVRNEAGQVVRVVGSVIAVDQIGSVSGA